MRRSVVLLLLALTVAAPAPSVLAAQPEAAKKKEERGALVRPARAGAADQGEIGAAAVATRESTTPIAIPGACGATSGAAAPYPSKIAAAASPATSSTST